MTFLGRFHLKARQSHKSTSNNRIPVQGVGENHHCNSTVLSTPRSQPEDYQNHLVLLSSFTAARLSATYTQFNTLPSLLLFSLSPHHMHDTALPIQVSNWTTSSGELQPLSAPRYRNHQFITVDFRLCLFSQHCYLIIWSFYFWNYSHAAGRSSLSYA